VYARVVTFEGGDPEAIRKSVAEIGERSADGPPEGVPAVGLLIMHNPDGKVVTVSLFETEEDRRQGDATLNSMDPPQPGAMGKRTSVEMFEVGLKIDI
jgi:hypothetical protein